jgi:hypothetical protein
VPWSARAALWAAGAGLIAGVGVGAGGHDPQATLESQRGVQPQRRHVVGRRGRAARLVVIAAGARR